MQNTATDLQIIDYALNYAAEFGWAVFPCHGIDDDGACTCGHADCKSPGKHPRTKNGSLDATRAPGAIELMFAEAELLNTNIGLATGSISGLVVVDVDKGKGADTAELIFGGIDQTVFNTPRIQTGAGLHFYYRLPAGVTIKNSASRLGKFIDVRGDGGYVIAPPSKHISGKHYQLLNPDNEQILEFPQIWLDKLNQPLPSSTNGTTANGNGNGSPFRVSPSGVTVPDDIDQGKRNVELTKIAGKLRDIGGSEAAIFAFLERENQRICKPPLDDKELRQIAHSVGRYTPKTPIDPVSDADPNAPDVLNSIQPYFLRDLFALKFEKKEILGFHIGRRDVAIIQAATNAGKTTLLRNVALSMAAGRPFDPFYEGPKAIKLAYFDFENDAQDVQRDLEEMFKTFTDAEKSLVDENFIIIPKGLKDGDLFQFNTSEEWASAIIQQNGVEFVFVDNVSAAYDLDNENNNAEVKRKIIKPLMRMALQNDCAFAFAHHYGKAKASEIEEAGVHAGRGASNLQNLSRTVINMFGDVSKGEIVRVVCAKRKTDGGQNYEKTFRLNPDRWFHSVLIASPPKKRSCVEDLVEYLEKETWKKVPGYELVKKFKGFHSRATIYRVLKEGVRTGMLKTRNGKYWLPDEDEDDDDS